MFIVNLLRKILAALISLIVLLWTGAGVGSESTQSDTQGYNLSFAVLSDVHMEGNNPDRFEKFAQILSDIKRNVPSDTIAFLGDNTMNGQIIENLFFHGFINEIKPVEKIYTVMGNHDTGNGIDKYDSLSKRFWSYYNTFNNENVDNVYYWREVNGYRFVFLGSESDNVNTSVISEAQLQWLDGVLDENDNTGKPVFVFNHHPYNYLENADNAVELERILTEHKNVFYLSGHTHTTQMDFEKFDEDSYSFNLPRCTEATDNADTNDSGLGLQIYVFDNEVQVKSRRYYDSQWGKYDFNYEIK